MCMTPMVDDFKHIDCVVRPYSRVLLCGRAEQSSVMLLLSEIDFFVKSIKGSLKLEPIRKT